MAHFFKRHIETLFVHRFSHGTMPIFNVFKNSFHYHVFSGLNLAYWLYGPWNASGTRGGEREEWLILTCVAVFVVCHLCHLCKCTYILRMSYREI